MLLHYVIQIKDVIYITQCKKSDNVLIYAQTITNISLMISLNLSKASS